ncbi:innate immunity activator protein-like [Oncorhynchus keta]|uniref:innate immunity activator protein-like n=1 Tax=Oncorhynchus keta TaxID=8018 RepID=UPI00227CEA67|nr:innate immunity activator protein-like [Oncorhynchus keta]
MVDKEETSDTDSGIILNSGPDSPTLPVKDLTTHTRAMRLKHQALENRLELCLLDLKKLCIREAELTGKLSSDYPLLLDEKPPCVRRRIGATFKLDDSLIHQDGEVQTNMNPSHGHPLHFLYYTVLVIGKVRGFS